MTHRILGWFLGILYVSAAGNETERFVNLCRNHGIALWGLSVDGKGKRISFYISLRDFYRLRKIVRKSKVFVVVRKRIGFPFFLQYMRRNISFFAGVFCMFVILFLLSEHIWSIEVTGQSYHTKESIVKYLDKKGIYAGMLKSELSCQEVRELLRKKYRDIGWISVEETGCFICIRIKEVQMAENVEKKQKGHLVAEADGTVVSIVTRKGTARVKAGKKVKKGDVLISGLVKIKGDGDVLIEKDYVHAEGNVVLKEEKAYSETLLKKYRKKVYTGRERKVYEWDLAGRKFFFYNPLNNLESYEKYDIIREGGLLCPEVSLRFPVKHYVKLFREIKYVSASYREEEAKRILEEHYKDFIRKKREAGFELVRASVDFLERGASYCYQGRLVFYHKQETYRTIRKKNKKYQG